MELKDIISISGISGLHKIVGQMKNGFIVETMDEKKARFATNLKQKVSVLEDISIYTSDGDVKLADVLYKMHKSKDKIKPVDPKADNAALKTYMKQILPDYDEERVYTSDIKKLSNWYHLLENQFDFETLNPKKKKAEKEEEGDKKEEGVKATKSATKKPGADKKSVALKTGAPKAGVKVKTTTPRKTV
jgi:hypothetical protein